MSVDREQIRRDASDWLNGIRVDKPHLAANAFAFHCLALLAELEQAEKDRDTARESLEMAKVGWNGASDAGHLYAKQLRELESRLAKVPALVEALKAFVVVRPDITLDPERVQNAITALAEWERE